MLRASKKKVITVQVDHLTHTAKDERCDCEWKAAISNLVCKEFKLQYSRWESQFYSSPKTVAIHNPTSISEFHFHFSFSSLPPTRSGSDLYELFGRYGAIRQIRLGDQPSKTKGTAYIVFEEVQDAKNAVNHLNGFHLAERYIVG